MKNIIQPILSLTLICFVLTFLLAFVNHFTSPVIQSAALTRATSVQQHMLPDAEYIFEVFGDFPESIVSAYKSNNNVGYVFTVQTRGYGGYIKIVIGINEHGQILASSVLSHTETQGLGTHIFDRANALEAEGRSLLNIDAVAGSTLTLRAYQRALSDALSAFEILEGTP